MRISLRFLCAEQPLPPGFREIEAPEGSTAEQAVAIYSKLYPTEDSLLKLSESVFLIGGKAVQHDAVLRDKDKVLVLRLPDGG